MNPEQHKRFLDYRERHVYFGHAKKALTMDEFALLEEENRLLTANTARDDEEEARLEEVRSLLHLD